MDQSCNSVYKSFKIFPDLYCKNWMFSSCVPSAYKDGHYFVQSGELFNSAEINIKRGKCCQGKGQSFSLFLQAEDMGWSAKYQKYVSILLLKLTYYLIAWLTSNDHETYSSGKQLSSLVTNSAPLHILSCSSSQLNINGNRFCFKIFTDPTAIIVIWVEKFEGAGRVHKFRIGYPKFSFLFFFPQREAFSILWQLQFFNLSSISSLSRFQILEIKRLPVVALAKSSTMNQMGLGQKSMSFLPPLAIR